MATSSTLVLFFLLAAFGSSTPSISTRSLSTSSSAQFDYWSKHVANHMPFALVEKLSPLTAEDTQFFDGILTTHRLSEYREIFCSKANLGCAKQEPLEFDHNGYDKGGSPEKVDPCFFFRLFQLKRGSEVCLSDLKEGLPNNSFLPRKLATKISFSVQEADNNLLQIFPKSTTVLQRALHYCNSSVRGEVRFCTISLEDMIDFAEATLSAKRIRALMTANSHGSKSRVVISGVKELKGDKAVICHPLIFPFSSYLCHFMAESRVYEVDVNDLDDGKTVNNVLAICHFNTSTWAQNHPSFDILKLSPGKGEICHWMSTSDIAWINA